MVGEEDHTSTTPPLARHTSPSFTSTSRSGNRTRDSSSRDEICDHDLLRTPTTNATIDQTSEPPRSHACGCSIGKPPGSDARCRCKER